MANAELNAQYDAELGLAEGAFASGDQGAKISVAGDLQGFLASHRSELDSGQIDQLERGVQRLTGYNMEGPAPAAQGSFGRIGDQLLAGFHGFASSLSDDVAAGRKKAGEILSSDNIKILAIVAGIFLAYKIIKG